MFDVDTKRLITALLFIISNVCTGLTVGKAQANNDDNKNDRRAVAFSFAKHFNNHMVLQKAPAKANIYGFSSEVGAAVTVTVAVSGGKTTNYQTTVKQGAVAGNGQWTVMLDPEAVGTTVTISAHSGGTNLTITDVIFGDVWLCSGQSNMEFTVSGMFEAVAEEADAKNYPNIRLMVVNNNPSLTPLDDVIQIQQAWIRASVGL